MDGEQRRQDAEEEGSENAVAKRFLLLFPRQPEHENGQHERVVGAQQALEQDEEGDGQKIRSVDIHSGGMHP